MRLKLLRANSPRDYQTSRKIRARNIAVTLGKAPVPRKDRNVCREQRPPLSLCACTADAPVTRGLPHAVTQLHNAGQQQQCEPEQCPARDAHNGNDIVYKGTIASPRSHSHEQVS